MSQANLLATHLHVLLAFGLQPVWTPLRTVLSHMSTPERLDLLSTTFHSATCPFTQLMHTLSSNLYLMTQEFLLRQAEAPPAQKCARICSCGTRVRVRTCFHKTIFPSHELLSQPCLGGVYEGCSFKYLPPDI